MKIAILTLRLKNNYGGILQAYALQTYLERLGHEVFVLNKDYTPQLSWKLLFKIPRRILCNLIGQKKDVFYEINERRMVKYVRPFIEKYIHSDSRNFSELKENDYDAIVVGSDQIWRPKYLGFRQPEISDVYLAFTRNWNIVRLAYAVSFGTKEWTYSEEQTQLAKELVKHFNSVSVREHSGINLCHDYLNVDASHLLDPTLLLDKEDYVNLVNDDAYDTKEPKGQILAYFLDLDSEKLEVLRTAEKWTSYISFFSGAKIDDENAPVRERIQPPVQDWIKSFDVAKFVVTDSFHGCVFSIIFRKPFIVVGNKDRGLARIESLLDQFGLGTDYIGYSGSNFVKYCDPSNISDTLSEMQEKSLTFFKTYLG